jgi:peptidoglycan/LPS O-acetylase OafA/YrhL
VPTLADRVEGRLNNFDVLRFALASTVLVSHSYPLTRGGEADPLADLTNGQFDGGELAVAGFFVISGFLIAGSWSRAPRLRDYTRKRVLRIYPAFLVAWLVGVLVVGAVGYAGTVAAYFRSLDVPALLANLLVFRIPPLPDVFSDSGEPHIVNGSLWTLSIEFQCYVLLAAAGLVGLLAYRRLLLALFVLLLAFVALDSELHLTSDIAPSGAFHAYLVNVFRLTAYFTAGTLAWLYRDRIPLRPRYAAAAALLLLVTLPRGLDVTMPIAGGYLLLYAAHAPAGRLAHFGRRRDLSYGVYLWAFPVQQLILYWLGDDVGTWTLTAVATVPVVALAFLSWHLIEAPALARARRRPSPAVVPTAEPVQPSV